MVRIDLGGIVWVTGIDGAIGQPKKWSEGVTVKKNDGGDRGGGFFY
jgi:hypothetical protein